MTFCTTSPTSSRNRRRLLKLGAAMGATILGAGKLQAQPDSAIKVAAVFSVPLHEPWVSRVHEALLDEQGRGEIEYVYAQDVPANSHEETLRKYAEQGVHLIVSDTFEAETHVHRVASAYPNVAFLVGSSGRPQQPNVAVFDNHIHEPTYLTGMIAGGMSQTGIIGLIAGHPVPKTNRLLHAFMDGVREINPDANFLVTFIQSRFAPLKARQAAFSQLDQGADVLYADQTGAEEAARQRGKLILGSTINSQSEYPQTVVTSALWDAAPTIKRALTMVRRGKFKADDYGKYSQMRYYGATLSSLGTFKNKIPSALIARVQARQQTILDGNFTIKLNDAPLQPTS